MRDLPRLHVLTDEVLQDRFDHVTLARLALEGGADAIQYREKRPISDRERLRVAEALAGLCARSGATLIIDDRPDVAALVGAGVHLGPADLPPPRVRPLVKGLLGATANDLGAALLMGTPDVDYLGCGPVYGTTSKGEAPPPRLGLDGLRAITDTVAQPVLAIGGLTPDRVPEVLAAGAAGIAVLGAVACAEDPGAATAAFAEALRAAGRAPRHRAP
jgi:thiamine-phosphate pyrophosphorylase